MISFEQTIDPESVYGSSSSKVKGVGLVNHSRLPSKFSIDNQPTEESSRMTSTMQMGSTQASKQHSGSIYSTAASNRRKTQTVALKSSAKQGPTSQHQHTYKLLKSEKTKRQLMNFYQQLKRSDLKQKRISGFFAQREPDSKEASPSSVRFASATKVEEPIDGGASPQRSM